MLLWLDSTTTEVCRGGLAITASAKDDELQKLSAKLPREGSLSLSLIPDPSFFLSLSLSLSLSHTHTHTHTLSLSLVVKFKKSNGTTT